MNGGTTVLASTLLGGSGEEGFHSVCVAVDGAGYVYVAGVTDSTDFPTTEGALDTRQNGDRDSIVSKLDTDLSSLIYSTYIGGSGDEQYGQIAVTEGVIIATGSTGSRGFPVTAGVLDESYNGGDADIFIMKMGVASSEESPDTQSDDRGAGAIPGFPPLATTLGVIIGCILLVYAAIC